MEPIYTYCPESFVTRWMPTVQRAGLIVHPADDGISGYVSLTSEDKRHFVEFRRGLQEFYCTLFGIPDALVEDLLVTIFRASGCRCYPDIPFCQTALYRCSKEFASNWPAHLKLPDWNVHVDREGIFLIDTTARARKRRERIHENGREVYPIGHVIHKRKTVRIAAGPAFDPSTHDEVAFLSLDGAGFFLSREPRLFVLKIDQILQTRGAERIRGGILSIDDWQGTVEE